MNFKYSYQDILLILKSTGCVLLDINEGHSLNILFILRPIHQGMCVVDHPWNKWSWTGLWVLLSNWSLKFEHLYQIRTQQTSSLMWTTSVFQSLLLYIDYNGQISYHGWLMYVDSLFYYACLPCIEEIQFMSKEQILHNEHSPQRILKKSIYI